MKYKQQSHAYSIYNKSIYTKVRETRLLITFHRLNFAEFQEKGNK